jgi:hypothetical protein
MHMTAPEPDGPMRLLELHPAQERVVSVRSLMRNAGKIRDGGLILIALSYGLGYLTWSTYAAAHGLGAVPALYADYVMTGLLPLFVLSALHPLSRSIGRFREWGRRTPSERGIRVGKWLSITAAVLILASLPLKWILNDEVYGWVLGIYGLVFLARAVATRGLGDGFTRGMLLFVIWYLVVFAVVIALVAYWEKVFSRWPQELGGPRPHCVVFDVDVSKLSAPMRGALLGPAHAADSSGMRASRPLYSIFSGGDFVLLKVGPEPLIKHEQVFRVPKAALGAESPCPGES